MNGVTDRRRGNDNRRSGEKSLALIPLGLALDRDQRSADRRRQARRRGDVRSLADDIASVRTDVIVNKVPVGRSQARTAMFACGCIAFDPLSPEMRVQVLECPAHAQLQTKLRRRRSDFAA